MAWSFVNSPSIHRSPGLPLFLLSPMHSCLSVAFRCSRFLAVARVHHQAKVPRTRRITTPTTVSAIVPRLTGFFRDAEGREEGLCGRVLLGAELAEVDVETLRAGAIDTGGSGSKVLLHPTPGAPAPTRMGSSVATRTFCSSWISNDTSVPAGKSGAHTKWVVSMLSNCLSVSLLYLNWTRRE